MGKAKWISIYFVLIRVLFERIKKTEREPTKRRKMEKFLALVIALVVIVAGISATKSVHSVYTPHHYGFHYTRADGHGNVAHRDESSDNGAVKGSYGYLNADGVYRTVHYLADGGGFKANIKTNEPGTASEDPADVHITSVPPPVLKHNPHPYVPHHGHHKYPVHHLSHKHSHYTPLKHARYSFPRYHKESPPPSPVKGKGTIYHPPPVKGHYVPRFHHSKYSSPHYQHSKHSVPYHQHSKFPPPHYQKHAPTISHAKHVAPYNPKHALHHSIPYNPKNAPHHSIPYNPKHAPHHAIPYNPKHAPHHSIPYNPKHAPHNFIPYNAKHSPHHSQTKYYTSYHLPNPTYYIPLSYHGKHHPDPKHHYHHPYFPAPPNHPFLPPPMPLPPSMSPIPLPPMSTPLPPMPASFPPMPPLMPEMPALMPEMPALMPPMAMPLPPPPPPLPPPPPPMTELPLSTDNGPETEDDDIITEQLPVIEDERIKTGHRRFPIRFGQRRRRPNRNVRWVPSATETAAALMGVDEIPDDLWALI